MKKLSKYLLLLCWLPLGFQYSCNPCLQYRNWYCPGGFGLDLYRGSVEQGRLLENYNLSKVKLTYQNGTPPDSLTIAISSVGFILKPGCDAPAEDLDKQVFRDTLYLWLPEGNSYDIDTLQFEYQLIYEQKCMIARHSYGHVTYNGELFDRSTNGHIFMVIKRR